MHSSKCVPITSSQTSLPNQTFPWPLATSSSPSRKSLLLFVNPKAEFKMPQKLPSELSEDELVSEETTSFRFSKKVLYSPCRLVTVAVAEEEVEVVELEDLVEDFEVEVVLLEVAALAASVVTAAVEVVLVVVLVEVDVVFVEVLLVVVVFFVVDDVDEADFLLHTLADDDVELSSRGGV